VLLVQLARDSRYSAEELSGAALLSNAEHRARLACDCVGGELIYVDCSKSMRSYYVDRGFIEMVEIPGENGEDGYITMQKQLYPDRSFILDALISDASK